MSTQGILILVAIGFVVGGVVGHVVGRARGRDEQWVDDYFAGVARDRARRDARGQFKARHDKARFDQASGVSA